jgi:glycosyltransferase involved in cell wall biosynthesis
MENKKVLFISHEASRTGAPILLLNLASALKESCDYEIDFLLVKDGELTEKFNKVGRTHSFWENENFDKNNYHTINPLFNKENVSGYDFIIANTIISSYIIDIVRRVYKGTILTYIHELSVVNRTYSYEGMWDDLRRCTNVFIAPCEAVKNFLINECEVSKDRVQTLPSYVPSTEKKTENDLSLKKDGFLVGCCGLPNILKGVDLFVRTAKLLFEKYPDADVKFVWKGGDERFSDVYLLQKDVFELGLEGKVFFEKATSDLTQFYNTLDVFLLLSREDSYPLVVLEAGSFGIPTICFKNAGGASEFVADNGVVAEYLDLDAVVDGIHEYYISGKKRRDDGIKSLIKFRLLHQDKQMITKKLLEIAGKGALNKVLTLV